MLILCVCLKAKAQTAEEWYQQKETQKKYLLLQIAALKVYLDYAEKGYAIANRGLQGIRSIKEGDFSLHNEFFNSLRQVNPDIKNWNRVADIIALQLKIVKQTKEVLAAIKESNQLIPEEMDYCRKVFDNLLTECLKNIDELIRVTASGELEMKDDERIKRIENLYLDMQDKFSFSSSFGEEIKLLSYQRLNEKREIEISRALSK
jgi:hypothetical protein